MSYDEHLISMAGGDGESIDHLAAIEARITTDESEYGTGYEWEHSFQDRRALIALVREQQARADRDVEAAIEAGLATHDWEMFEAKNGDIAEAVAEAIRAAITATEEGE